MFFQLTAIIVRIFEMNEVHKHLKYQRILKIKFMKMKKIILFSSVAMFALFAANSCGSSVPDSTTSKTYDVTDFSSLNLELIGEVIYEQADSLYVKASGSSVLIEALEVTQKNGELSLELKNKRSFSGDKKKLVITIGSPSLKEIDFKSVGKLHIKNNFKGDKLTITNEGVGEIKIDDCHVNSFKLISKSVGVIKVKGSTNSASIDSEGVGKIDCSQFKSKKTEVVSTGTGAIEVYASESVDISVSGIGNVQYYGSPKDIKTDVSQIGRATNMGN
jgi:hypothetical protein